jgi:3-mercaptopyruvate sulfurtransferase SseA
MRPVRPPGACHRNLCRPGRTAGPIQRWSSIPPPWRQPSSRAGHIPGAINVPLADNLDSSGRFKSPEALRQRYLAVLGDTPPETVIAMCGSGVTACHNLLAMAIAGLPLGRLYAGSWSEWIRDPSRPVATGN